MRAFDFVLLFLSFVYALALTHVLMAAARMIRHRHAIVFSVPHVLWMFGALLLVVGNWLSLWDFRSLTNIPETTIATGFAFSVLVYFFCALVSPDVSKEGTTDLREFHQTQGATYIGVALLLIIASVLVNFAAGAGMGVQKWASENSLVIAMLVPAAAALWVRKDWVQIAAPLMISGFMLVYIFLYYPTLGQ